MTNLLDLKPVRTCEWRQSDEGRVVVLVPKFRGRRFGQWLMARLKNPYLQVKLDRFGSWVWLRCDGDHTVEAIAADLKEEFGDVVEPVYERVAMFIKQMLRGDLIVVESEGSPVSSGSRARAE